MIGVPAKDYILSIYKTKAFFRLQNEWYKKIKSTGFNDIEKTFDNGDISIYMKQSCRIDSKRHPYILASTQEYYSLVGEFLYVYDFPTPRERLLWELYGEGKPYRTIAAATHLSLNKTFHVIHMIRREMFEHFDVYFTVPDETEFLSGSITDDVAKNEVVREKTYDEELLNRIEEELSA